MLGRGPVWSYENSTYHQTGVDINVGGSLSASAGGNLVAQGVNANVGGSTSLRAGGDMQLTTALRGHVNSFEFYNKYKSAGDLLKISQRINSRDIDLQNSGNGWNSGAGVNLSAGNNLSLVGAQIKANSYSASAGGSYQERAAYDVKENVHIETTKRTGLGVHLSAVAGHATKGGVFGFHEASKNAKRTETHVDSTRTAIVTNINAGSGAVTRNVGGDAFIEGSVIQGGEGLVEPLKAGGKVTQAAAVDTRHVEDSVSTSSLVWQSTKSKGSIEQTLHMPQIHGLPEGMSAYQGAGGVSVQLPAGSNVRTAIETLSQKPGQGYLKELGQRSDIDWQRVEELNKSLDFSKSGLTPEATIAVIIVVSILTYGYASAWGASAAAGAEMTATAGTAGAVTTTTAAGATVTLSATGAAVATGVTAGLTSLASTAAVSLINNQGDLGATLKELGSEDNAKGLLLTMATAGLSNGILNQVGLSGVDANSTVGQLLAKNTIQGISSAVLESAVMGTSLEDALKNNLKGALINTVAAQGADSIGDAKLDATSKALAHALLGCAVGTATAGSSSGCAPGATGAVIGEIVAGLYADASGYDQLKIDANKPGADPALKQQLDVMTHTMTELAKLTGAGGALLIGGDASTMQTAMGTAQNAAVNNRALHASERALAQELARRSNGHYTAAQIEEQMRLMGNMAFNEVPNQSAVATNVQAIATLNDQDPGMPQATDGKTVVEIPGQANTALQQFIISNTTEAASYIPGVSPYVASNASLNKPVTTNTPAPTATAACANGDFSCISGVGVQQNAPLSQQARDAIAATAAAASRQAGVVAAGATAAAAAGSPQVKPIAGAVAVGATAIGLGADAVEQVMRPDTGQVVANSTSLILQTALEKLPVGQMLAPITNEVFEAWQASGSSLTVQEWVNRQLGVERP